MWEGTTNLLDPVRTFPKKMRLNSLLTFLLTRYSLEKYVQFCPMPRNCFTRDGKDQHYSPKKTCRVTGTYLPAIHFQYGATFPHGWGSRICCCPTFWSQRISGFLGDQDPISLSELRNVSGVKNMMYQMGRFSITMVCTKWFQEPWQDIEIYWEHWQNM